VSQNAVERTLGKLATDEEFRARFFANPEAATWEAGLSLSPVELEALSRLSRAAIARFSQSLDGRIRRLCVLWPLRADATPADRHGRGDVVSDAMTHYTPWAVFASVFVNQAGLPVPVVPSLVIATRSGRTLTALVIALALAGCASVGPDYKRPAVSVPQEWRTTGEGVGSMADLEWWQLFQDPVLRDLIATALEENRDLRLAVARVAEARAQLAVTRAAQFPQVDAQGSYTNQRFSQKSFPFTALRSFPGASGLDVQQDFYRTGLELSFELDLWGRLRCATEGARADLLASAENTRTVLTTLISDVAQSYFDLLELDREADVDRQTLASRQASLELVRRRFDDGLTSELDVRRAEQELAAAAAVPDVKRRIAQTENRLSILLGHNPGPIQRGTALDAQRMPPQVPAGLPSTLLERRPDVREAEQKLISANAHIGEAKAAFFPRISLTGMFGLESASLSELFTGPAHVWQVGPTVTFPVFHGGQLRANLRAAEARQHQALIQYQQTIQQAFREVDDALVFRAKASDIRTQQEARVQAAQRALDIANLRYISGLGTYLDVLDAQRQLFSAQVDLAGTTRDHLTAVVQVYKALGGGWEMQ